MPELPDITAYLAALESRIVGRPLLGVRLASPFLLRTAEPPLALASGRRVRELKRLGKRIAIGLEGDLWLVLHLMIAGRLHWRAPGAKLAGRNTLAAFDFDDGSLVLTEAGTKRRASLHVAEGHSGLEALDPGGIDVLSSSFDTFKAALVEENRTLKRALTDPRILSGIGNAYSDEILHAARLSPLALTRKLKEDEWARLYAATLDTLRQWTDRLVGETAAASPRKSPPFARRWRCTAATASRARAARIRCSASATPTTRRITARVARPAGSCSPIADCRDCSARTGRARSMSSRR